MLRAYTSDGFAQSAYVKNGAAIGFSADRSSYVSSAVASNKLSLQSSQTLLSGLQRFLESTGQEYVKIVGNTLSPSQVEEEIFSLSSQSLTDGNTIDEITFPELINLMPDNVERVLDIIDGSGVTGALDTSGIPTADSINIETAITQTFTNKSNVLASDSNLTTRGQLGSMAYTPLSVISDTCIANAHTAVDSVLTEPSNSEVTTTQIVVGGVIPGNDGNDVPGISAKLIRPSGLAIADNLLYVADKADNSIRAVSLISGRIINIAGNDQISNDSQKISGNLTFPSDELLIFRDQQGESGNPNTGRQGVIRGLADNSLTTSITEGSINRRFGSIPTYRVPRRLEGIGNENVPALKTKIMFNALSDTTKFPGDIERTAGIIRRGAPTTDFTGATLNPAPICANIDGTVIFCEADQNRVREIPRIAIY